MPSARPIPDGLHSLTPHIVVKDAARMIEFYARAFGAVEKSRMMMPDGKLGHAELAIGDSALFLADEFPDQDSLAPATIGGGSSTVLHLYVEDADATFQRATAAGATVRMPLGNQFWGDRYGQVVDPAGHVWAIATHLEDLTGEEMARRMAQMVGRG